MNKTHLTYVLMVATFAGGLWAILRLGSVLHAASNVAGEWQLRWTDSQPGDNLPDRMTVDQSGRYLVATLKSSGAPVRMDGRILSSRGDQPRFSLRNSTWKLQARLDENQLSGSLDTPAPHALQARRMAPQP